MFGSVMHLYWGYTHKNYEAVDNILKIINFHILHFFEIHITMDSMLIRYMAE